MISRRLAIGTGIVLGLAILLPILQLNAAATEDVKTPIASMLIERQEFGPSSFSFLLNSPEPTMSAEGLVEAPGMPSRIQTAGEPALPYYSTFIALPPGATANVSVETSEIGEFEVGMVRPAPEVTTAAVISNDDQDTMIGGELASIDEGLLRATPDPDVYGQDALYPATLFRVSEPMYARDIRLVRLDLFPFRYNPVAAKLWRAGRLAVSVRFNGSATAGRVAPSYRDNHARVLDTLVLNATQAQSWRGLPPDLTGPGTQLPIGVDVYKIEVDEDGIYEITYADLLAAGMDVGLVDPHTFQMLYQGQPIAYQFVGDADAAFEAGEKVRFYGWAFDGSRHDQQFFLNNVFWLWAGGVPNTISIMPSQTGFTPADSFPSSVTRQPENYWFPTYTDQWDDAPNEPDAWFWDRLVKGTAPITRTYTITLPNPAIAGPEALFTAEFTSSPSLVYLGQERAHDVTVIFEDHPNTASATWFGKKNLNLTNTVPISAVVNGVNELKVVFATDAPIGTPNSVYLNRLTVDYRRSFIAEGDSLIFSDDVGGQRAFQISGFVENDPAQVLVWDITNRNNPVSISGISVSGSGTYTHSFGTDHSVGAMFVASGTSSVLQPQQISRYVPSELDPPAGADWVAIAYHDFLTETIRLATHRSGSQFVGLSTHVVDVEDVINEYGYGLPTPDAIRSYMLHGLANWPTPPSYLLLVGDATINPHYNDIIGYPYDFFEPQLLLTDLVFVDRWNGQIASDHTFSLLSGSDLLPDIAVGRIAAKTAADMAAVVDKTITYDQNQLQAAAWMQNAVFVADDADQPGDEFCQENLDVGDHLASSFNQVHLCLDNMTADEIRTLIFTYTNEIGTTLLNYRGHGAINAWGTPVILDDGDLAEWDNLDRPVVIITGDCLDGYFIDPRWQSLGELFLRASNGGTAAHWSSTGLGVSNEHSALVESFYDGLYQVGLTDIGFAANYAKIQFLGSGGHRSLAYTFLTQGDPALQLHRPELSLGKSSQQTQVYPGDQVDFTLQINNNGIYPAIATVTDTLPAGLNFITATTSVNSSVAVGGSEVVFDLRYGSGPPDDGIPWGGSVMITLTAEVDASAPPGMITNQAVVSGTGLEAVPGDESDTATIEILSNAAPQANDDLYTTDLEGLSVPAPGVLTNDSDPDGDPLVAFLQSGPGFGSVTLNTDGSFIYTPNPGFTGLDIFTYRAVDTHGEESTASVFIIVGTRVYLPMVSYLPG